MLNFQILGRFPPFTAHTLLAAGAALDLVEETPCAWGPEADADWWALVVRLLGADGSVFTCGVPGASISMGVRPQVFELPQVSPFPPPSHPRPGLRAAPFQVAPSSSSFTHETSSLHYFFLWVFAVVSSVLCRPWIREWQAGHGERALPDRSSVTLANRFVYVSHTDVSRQFLERVSLPPPEDRCTGCFSS